MKQERYEVIAVDGFIKRFGAITAVDNISFSVPDGEIFGFLGPNGAGKTTTIRMLTGLLTPDAGEILIGGVNLQKRPIAAKMQMGVIPEMSNVYTDLTCLLYTSDAADEEDSVDLGGRRIIKKK